MVRITPDQVVSWPSRSGKRECLEEAEADVGRSIAASDASAFFCYLEPVVILFLADSVEGACGQSNKGFLLRDRKATIADESARIVQKVM